MAITFENLTTSANAKVEKWLLNRYHEDTSWNTRQGHPHLVDCPDATIEDMEGQNGTYGCDTGCEYARLSVTIRCLHGYVDDDWEYGTFGDIASMLEAILDIDAIQSEEPHA